LTAIEPGSAVAILGSGTMGRGIARVAAGAGHDVVLFDVSTAALETAQAEMHRYLERDVEKGRLHDEEAAQIGGRVRYTDDAREIGSVSLVVEAIVEDLEGKVDLLRTVEAALGTEAIVATNTSSLSVTAIAARLARPERVAGMHFFNPAPIMPLVEIIAGSATHPSVLATLTDTAAAWGKTPVRAASTPGFIVNRVARPFYGEALRLVEEGVATPAEIDAVVTGAGGFRMGPFALMDLVGLDVNLAVSKSVYEQTYHDPRFAPNQIQQQLVDAGRLGRKSGAGFFDYTGGAPDRVRSVDGAGPIEKAIVHGSTGGLGGLAARLEAEGVGLTTGYGPAPGIAVGSTLLWPSNGRPVSAVDPEIPDLTVVAVDECIDWSTASAVALAGDDEPALGEAAAILGAAGIRPLRVGDGPGLVMLRIMAQLASVAADAALKGVATAADIDTAMRLGTNYPIGPLEWVDTVGAARVVAALDNMADYYGEDRYRPAPLLRRAADSGRLVREVV